MMMSITMKRYVPMGLAIFSGFAVIFGFFLDIPIINTVEDTLTSWVSYLNYFAVLVGTAGVLRLSIPRLLKRGKDWPIDAYSITMIAVMFGLGMTVGTKSFGYTWLYDNFYRPVSASIFAMLGFYLLSASYRAFRVKSLPVLGSIIAVILILINSAPAGPALFPTIASMAVWVRDVPSKAGMRGYIMAAAFGAISIGIRVLVGRETTYLGQKGQEEEL
jgi:hypothetical protein